MRQAGLGFMIAMVGALAIAGGASATTPGTNRGLVYISGGGIAVDPDGAGPKDGSVILTPAGKVVDVAVSPDGTHIAYALYNASTRGDIWVVSITGANPVHVTSGTVDDREPSWSPDGSRLVFSRQPDDSREALWIVNRSGSGAHALTAYQDGRVDFTPAWSPDGRRIAFSRYPSSGPDTDVWVVDVDGTHAHAITKNDVRDEDPDWSPDGTRIAYSNYGPDNPDNQVDVYVQTLASGFIENITSDKGMNTSDPRWSPDGTHIAYSANDSSDSAIYWRPAGGGAEAKLSDSSPDLLDNHPAWIPGCSIKGDGKPNVLNGTAASELICAKGGADTVTGGGGIDIILLGGGDDRASGGAGNDVIIGGAGKDRIDGATGSDLCRPGAGGLSVVRCER